MGKTIGCACNNSHCVSKKPDRRLTAQQIANTGGHVVIGTIMDEKTPPADDVMNKHPQTEKGLGKHGP
jgi:hypothetical protein